MIAILTLFLAQAGAAGLVEEAVKAAGGADALPVVFRVKERIAVTADLEAKGSERNTILNPPGHWWLGKRNRVTEDREPAVYLAWAWSLRMLVDPASSLELLPPKAGLVGLRVSKSVEPPMEVWFDRERRLSAIDWRKDRHVFSEWKEAGGFHYASRVVGYKLDGKAWYHTRVLEFERLKEVPPGLPR